MEELREELNLNCIICYPMNDNRCTHDCDGGAGRNELNNKKNQKAIEIARNHGMTYDEALKYLKKHHPEWED